MGIQNKVYSLLGIAMKGRHAVSGEFQTQEAVKSGEAKLVLVAEDASENTKKLFHDKCAFYHVPVYVYGKKEDLGRAIGKDLRSSVAICDMGLAAALRKQLETETEGLTGAWKGEKG
ncbi:MAG: ribosomal L7Ae/L30e/S12e/Gadd45 family protein [Lachnospiraceae bacterium]|nr:ribosomal L7Ae/L30e/S12e/Gadd45 family protein [Lachnospiraceae bacterium]